MKFASGDGPSTSRSLNFSESKFTDQEKQKISSDFSSSSVSIDFVANTLPSQSSVISGGKSNSSIISASTITTMSCPSGDDSCAINELLEGRMNLLVILPRDIAVAPHAGKNNSVIVNVDRKTPMLDILVNIATQYRFNASKYRLSVDGHDFKASTPIGSLDVNQVLIVPKINKLSSRQSWISSGESSKTAGGTSADISANGNSGSIPNLNVPFQTTFRLQVNLPRNQLMVLRVSPDLTISQVKSLICEKKELDGNRYQLTTTEDRQLKLLESNRTLAYYGVHEVTLVSARTLSELQQQMSGSTPPTLNGHIVCQSTTANSGNRKEIQPLSSASNTSSNKVAKLKVAHKKRPAPPPPLLTASSLTTVEVHPSDFTISSSSTNGNLNATINGKCNISGSSESSPMSTNLRVDVCGQHQDSGSDSSGYHESTLSPESIDSTSSVTNQASTTSSRDKSNRSSSVSSAGDVSAKSSVINPRVDKVCNLQDKPYKLETSGQAMHVMNGKKRKAPAPPPPTGSNQIVSHSSSTVLSSSEWRNKHLQDSIECLSDVSVPLSSSSAGSSSKSTGSDYRTPTEHNSAITSDVRRVKSNRRPEFQSSSFTPVSSADDEEEVEVNGDTVKNIRVSKHDELTIPSPDSGTCCQTTLEDKCDNSSDHYEKISTSSYSSHQIERDSILQDSEVSVLNGRRMSYEVDEVCEIATEKEKDKKLSLRITEITGLENGDYRCRKKQSCDMVERMPEKSVEYVSEPPELECKSTKSSMSSPSPASNNSNSEIFSADQILDIERNHEILDHQISNMVKISSDNASQRLGQVFHEDKTDVKDCGKTSTENEHSRVDRHITTMKVSDDERIFTPHLSDQFHGNINVKVCPLDKDSPVVSSKDQVLSYLTGENGSVDLLESEAKDLSGLNHPSIIVVTKEDIMSKNGQSSVHKLSSDQPCLHSSTMELQEVSCASTTENSVLEVFPDGLKDNHSRVHSSGPIEISQDDGHLEHYVQKEVIKAENDELTCLPLVNAIQKSQASEQNLFMSSQHSQSGNTQEDLTLQDARDLCRPRKRLTNFRIGSYKPVDIANIYETSDSGKGYSQKVEDKRPTSQGRDKPRPKSLILPSAKPVIVTASLKDELSIENADRISDNFAKPLARNNTSNEEDLNSITSKSKITVLAPQPFKIYRMSSWGAHDLPGSQKALAKQNVCSELDQIYDDRRLETCNEKISTAIPNKKKTASRCVSQIEINQNSTKVSIRNTVEPSQVLNSESPIQVITLLNPSESISVLPSGQNSLSSTFSAGRENKIDETSLPKPARIRVELQQLMSSKIGPPISIKPTLVKNSAKTISVSERPVLSSLQLNSKKDDDISLPPPPPPPPLPTFLFGSPKSCTISSPDLSTFKKQMIADDVVSKLKPPSFSTTKKNEASKKDVPKFKKFFSPSEKRNPNHPTMGPKFDFHDALLNEIRSCGGRGALRKVSVNR